MKIFLSWSGPRSRAIAEALNDWLRRMIQAVKPFYSPEIDKGAKWSGEIDNALEGTSFGIICLTRDNLNSTWIHFEAGALSKTKDALIWTFLHGLTPGDVPPPLGKFQHTVAEKSDTLLLLKTINKRLGEVGGESLTEKLLEENFETFWPQLESKLKAVEKLAGAVSTTKSSSALETQRDSREILDEILELVRNQERRLSGLEQTLISVSPAATPTRKGRGPRVSSAQIDVPFEKDCEDPDAEVARVIDVLGVESRKLSPSDIFVYVVSKGKSGCLLRIVFEPDVRQDMVQKLVLMACPPGTLFRSIEG